MGAVAEKEEPAVSDSSVLDSVTRTTSLGSLWCQVQVVDTRLPVFLDCNEVALPATATFPSFDREVVHSSQQNDHHIAQAVKWVKSGHKPTDRQAAR